MLTLGGTVIYSRVDVRGGVSNTEMYHLRAAHELSNASVADFVKADPTRLYASLRYFHRSQRPPFRSSIKSEILPVPDGRDLVELANELKLCYNDKRASHALVLQMAANKN